MRIVCIVAATALLICVLISSARSQNSGPGALVFSTIVQPQRWHVTDFAINNRKSVLYGGGGGNQADGLVLVTDSQSRKFLSFDDSVPGVPDNYFWGVRSISLNDRDETAFAAVYGPCGDWYHCEQSEGIFTYAQNSITKVVSSGDLAPATGGLVFWGFDRIWFNNRGMVLFQGSFGEPIGSSGVLPGSMGLFIYDGSRLDLVTGSVSNSSRVLAFNDDGSVYLSTLGGTVFKYSQGKSVKLIARGDSLPGYGTITSDIWDVAASKSGNIVFRAELGDISNQGLFLLSRDGNLTRIISNGDTTPAGGTYKFWYTAQTRGGLMSFPTGFNPVVNDSGAVLFSAPIEGAVRGALFLFRNGMVTKVLADGDPVPGNESTRFAIDAQTSVWADYALHDQDMAALFVGGNGLFLFVDGISGFAGQSIQQINPMHTPALPNGKVMQLNDYGDVLFGTDTGLFLASIDSAIVPNGSFESPGRANRPANWETTWSSGSGSASLFQCGPEAAFDGSSVLRLKVVPSAGSAFVLSDPFPVLPDQHYRLSSQLRHYLNGSEAAYFSVLEFDSSGNLSSFNETSAHAGENAWNWQLESVRIRTAPNTAYIRIRFGLVAQDSYLDVDDVRIAALP
jgi:hypothetical protein